MFKCIRTKKPPRAIKKKFSIFTARRNWISRFLQIPFNFKNSSQLLKQFFFQSRSKQFWKQNIIVIFKLHDLFRQNFYIILLYTYTYYYYFRIIFDGDVDPEWVENINSVLDDNRLLTLPNGERLSLPPNVRIMFEVQDLKYATLATVSRCGMVRNH